MRELPQSITAVAFQAANGEFAWRRSNVPDALRAIAASGHAVLGGEVWVVAGDRITGLVPSCKGEPPGVWHGETLPRSAKESWADYCHRTANDSIRTVEMMAVEDEVREDVRDSLFFNITYVEEGEA